MCCGACEHSAGPPPPCPVWVWGSGSGLCLRAHMASHLSSASGPNFCGAPLVHWCSHGCTPTLTLGLGQPLPHLRGQDPGASNCCGSPVAARTEQKTEPVGWTLLGFAGRLGQAMGSCGWRGWLEGPALRTGTPLARGSLPAHLAPCGFHSKGFSPLGSC